jgi:hypothetical protein
MDTQKRNVCWKTCMIFSTLLLLAMTTTYGQNPCWFFPPKYVDMRTGTVHDIPNTSIPGQLVTNFTNFATNTITTIPGTPLNKQSDYVNPAQLKSANGLIRNDGSLAFYFSNRAIVAPQQTIMLKGFPYNEPYNPPNAIIPVPGTNNSFFVISSITDGTVRTVQYKQLNLGVSSGMEVVDKGNITMPAANTSFPSYMIVGMALSKPNLENGISGYDLYLKGEDEYTSICRVSSTGISYRKSIITFAEIFEHPESSTEFELTSDQTKLYYTKTGTANEDIWEYDLSSTSPTPRNTYILGALDNLVRVSGVEYSPANNRIYFAENEGYKNANGDRVWDNGAGSPYVANRGKIGYFTRITTGGNIWQMRNMVTIPLANIQYVTGSEGLGNSQLEMGPDGLVYASDGTYLKGFDPAAANPSIIKVIPVYNPVNKYMDNNALLSLYTLINQTDGLDYSTLSAPVITTGNVPSATLLTGSNFFSLPFTIKGAFNSGNMFTVQISDVNGSFASPFNLGGGSSTGIVSFSIPSNFPTGTGYRMRVVSNNPAVIGTDNGVNITIAKPQITVGAISPTSYVAGNTITVRYTVNGPFNNNNVFTAQLSNSGGLFDSPVNLGSFTASASGKIYGVIPVNIKPGSAYKIRVIASSPAATSTPSENITIIAPPSITTGSVTPTSLCAGKTVTVPFTTTGTFYPDNVFKAQLSNASGVFGASGYLTTVKVNPGSLVVIIPAGIANGASYRIRIIATSPATNGTDNGAPLTITSLPAFTVTPASADICAGDVVDMSVNDVSGLMYTWSPAASVIMNTPDGRNVSVNPIETTVFTITGTSASGCTKTSTATVNVYACRKAKPAMDNREVNTEKDEAMSLYPNPARETITVPLFHRGNIRIINSQGKVIKDVSPAANGSISIQDLDAGMYHVKFITGNTVKTEKLEIIK